MWAAVVFVLALVGLQVAGWRALARKDFRRAGGAGLSALNEIVLPHAAEHQRLEEHAADVDEDDDGAPDLPHGAGVRLVPGAASMDGQLSPSHRSRPDRQPARRLRRPPAGV